MKRLGIEMPQSAPAYTVEEAEKIAAGLGYPVVVRPAYTLGGTGGGLVYNVEELRVVASRGIAASMIGQILIEESVLGWEELELEVVRDAKNQMITVCFIENVDAMGVHTGDSYCTAPMLTIDPAFRSASRCSAAPAHAPTPIRSVSPSIRKKPPTPAPNSPAGAKLAVDSRAVLKDLHPEMMDVPEGVHSGQRVVGADDRGDAQDVEDHLPLILFEENAQPVALLRPPDGGELGVEAEVPRVAETEALVPDADEP
jgi:hypothetical protein